MNKRSQLTFLILTLLGSLLVNLCNAQPKKAPEFSFEIEWNSDKTAFNLTISIEKGFPDYTVELYDNEPWENGNLILSKKNIAESTIEFLNVSAQNLYIQVYDATSLKNVKYLKINE